MSASRRDTGLSTSDFLTWEPPEHQERRWQLIDGNTVCMAPTSENHGAIQSEVARFLSNHLHARRSACRVIIAPGVVPRVRATNNYRIPDLGVTCTPPSANQMMENPVVLIEILSPSNAAVTRENLWAYCSIPSVKEVLLLHGLRIEAEVLRRDAQGDWPAVPAVVTGEEDLELESLGFRTPLINLYRTTSLLPPMVL